MQYIEHPLIKPNSIEAREFQVKIAEAATKRSTLVVIPTGLGKTVIALLVIAEILLKKGPLVLFLAPTKPLVEQHYETLRKFLLASPIVHFTGEISPKERERRYRDATVIISTPQVIYNDLLSGRFTLDKVNLIIFDEAHRAVGNYAYVPIARRYLLERPDALSMGLTASPGWDEKKILTVCTNLGIDHVEIRTHSDPDVAPYVQEIDIDWIKVEVPEGLKVVINILEDLLKEYAVKMAKMGLVYNPKRLTTKELIEVGKAIRKRMAESGRRTPPHLFHAASLQAQALKISHALELAETQGPKALFQYLDRLVEEAYSPSASKASKAIVKNEKFRKAYNLAEAIKDLEHPKVRAAVEVVRQQIREKRDSRIILFAQYRDTATLLLEKLQSLGDPDIRPVRFVGQASRKGDRGLKQREQKEIIEKFRRGIYNVLIATSVAEEGLDIPSTDLVVFYEPVPSEIRTIQRRGRTGRTRMGKVVILITRQTRDVAYYFSSIKKERRMEAHLKRLRASLRQRRLIEEDEGEHSLFVKTGSGEEAEGEPEVRSATPAAQLTLAAFGSGEVEKKERESPESAGKSTSGVVEKDCSVVIWADHRELSSPVVERLRDLGAEVAPVALQVGDYVLSGDVAIERKSAADFARSIVDGRLFSQARELKNSYPKPIIVIEGNLEDAFERLSSESLWGAVASLIVDLGIPVVRTFGPEETATFLVATGKRLKKGKSGPPPLRRRKSGMTLEEHKRYVLEGLPNVSASTAQRLLEEFGTLREVFNASQEDLKKIKGIGSKKAEEIYKIMNS